MKTRVNAKGQIVIPVELRRKYGIRKGTRIVLLDQGDSIELKPVTEEYLRRLQGSLKGRGAFQIFMNDRNKEAIK